jgi:ABC-type nitrate/sulfonate/bicarbonate transport system ATPase subunit
MVAEPAAAPSPLAVRGLRVVLPDGRVLIDGVDLTIGAGEVVVLLGGSRAGKSTFARVLFERDERDAAGFDVVAAELALDRDQLGLVPQRGALFDHLDVRGNLELALRHAHRGHAGHAAARDGDDPETWLSRVGLDARLAVPGTSVTSPVGSIWARSSCRASDPRPRWCRATAISSPR